MPRRSSRRKSLSQLPGATRKHRRAADKENTGNKAGNAVASWTQQQGRQGKKQSSSQSKSKQQLASPLQRTLRKTDPFLSLTPCKNGASPSTPSHNLLRVPQVKIVEVERDAEPQIKAQFSFATLASTAAAAGGSGAVATGLLAGAVSHSALALDLCSGGAMVLMFGLIGTAYVKTEPSNDTGRVTAQQQQLESSSEEEQAGLLALC